MEGIERLSNSLSEVIVKARSNPFGSDAGGILDLPREITTNVSCLCFAYVFIHYDTRLHHCVQFVKYESNGALFSS